MSIHECLAFILRSKKPNQAHMLSMQSSLEKLAPGKDVPESRQDPSGAHSSSSSPIPKPGHYPEHQAEGQQQQQQPSGGGPHGAASHHRYDTMYPTGNSPIETAWLTPPGVPPPPERPWERFLSPEA